MTIIALPPGTTPTVVCPDWCTLTLDQHVAELHDLDGSVIHHGAEYTVAGCDVSHTRQAYPDGTPEPCDLSGEADMVMIGRYDMTVDQAEAFAHAILMVVRQARS